MTSSQPSLRQKVLFWLLLGMLSTYFAETISASTLFPFTSATGLLLVLPLYLLHSIVLATIVFRFGRPRFHTLMAAGMLFGMYEAYLTKVLWVSSLPGGPLLRIGGLAVPDVFVLVFFWHPLMGFALPLTVAERTLTASRTIRFARWKGSAAGWLALAVVLGVNQSFYSTSPLRTFAAGLIAIVVLLATARLWHGTLGNRYELPSLLPDGRQFTVLTILLIGYCLLLTFSFHTDRLPGLKPQLSVLALYAVLTAIFVFQLKKSRAIQETIAPSAELPLKIFALLLVIVTVTATSLASLLGGIGGLGQIGIPVAVVGCSVAGIVLFVKTLVDTLRRSTPALLPTAQVEGHGPDWIGPAPS